MTSVVKISACVDCRTPIIGDRQRCPACYQAHAEGGASDDDVTIPRPRQQGDLLTGFLARWVLGLEIAGIIVLALVLVGKGCS